MSHQKKSKPQKILFQSPKGIHDIIAPDILIYQKIRKIVEDVADFYNFSFIEPAIIEQADLFESGIGMGTDIVEKQMYVFRTRGGDRLALRPEGTAGVVRAYIQQGMFNYPQPVKLWYWGPMFRHENPQAGRFRQFFQAGFEYFGEEHPAVDVEIIQIIKAVLEETGIKNFRVEVNSIGCSRCRSSYRTVLKNYYRPRFERLCTDCKRRFRDNPLRLLDCKNEVCVLMKEGAPETVEYICDDCRAHFKTFLDFLEDLSFAYRLNPRLVRGLDYYNRTVFEIVHPASAGEGRLDSTAMALASGGRFDYLVEALGGPRTFATGGAIGIERLIQIYKAENIKLPAHPLPDVFMVQLGELAKKRILKFSEELRRSGIGGAMTLGRDSLKAQLKVADRMGVTLSLIIGQKEALDNTAIIRDMKTGIQEVVKQENIIKELKKRLRKKQAV